MSHSYPDIEDVEDPMQFVREYSDEELVEEFEYLTQVYVNILDEIVLRGDKPKYSDGTEHITGSDVKLRDLVVEIEAMRRKRQDED